MSFKYRYLKMSPLLVLVVTITVTITGVQSAPTDKEEAKTSEEGTPTDATEQSSSSPLVSLIETKCKEYAEYVNETVANNALSLDAPPTVTKDRCVRETADKFIVGGQDAKPGEFPHMALVGYRLPEKRGYQWICGGSLISDQYVLTAAHCESGEPRISHVLLGEHILRDDSDGADPQLVRIAADKGIIVHPQFKAPYNDIALIRLAKKAKLGPKVRPACLPTGQPFPQDSLIASGWGQTKDTDDASTSDILMKVKLSVIQCETSYSKENVRRTFPSGVKPDIQFCAGNLDGGKDTCYGDSGGPLQVIRSDPYCMYEVIGTVGLSLPENKCGGQNFPIVYSKVQGYLDWIVKTVWPELL